MIMIISRLKSGAFTPIWNVFSLDGTAVQRLAIMPHSKKVPCTVPGPAEVSVWSFLHISASVSSRIPLPQNMYNRIYGKKILKSYWNFSGYLKGKKININSKSVNLAAYALLLLSRPFLHFNLESVLSVQVFLGQCCRGSWWMIWYCYWPRRKIVQFEPLECEYLKAHFKTCRLVHVSHLFLWRISSLLVLCIGFRALRRQLLYIKVYLMWYVQICAFAVHKMIKHKFQCIFRLYIWNSCMS